MQKLTLCFSLFLFLSCSKNETNKEQIIFDRIEFVFNLKQSIENDIWKTFTNKSFDVPLIYYTDSSSYIANPTDNFLKTIQSQLVFESKDLKIYKTLKRADSIPFHMETSITLGTPTKEYNYLTPFMQCSSYEEFYKQIPDVLSTEEWVTMVMHEYFHGFQYKHPTYLNYFEKNIFKIQADSLTRIYEQNPWFKKSIDYENKLLLQTIEEIDPRKTEILITDFFTQRKARRTKTKEKILVDVSNYEKSYETLEGTARYVEYSLYSKFSNFKSDSKITHSDNCFKSFKKFKNYSIKKDKWLYLTEETNYFYAIGFNMARLLDKLKIEYKSRLFSEGGLSLEDILRNRK